MKKTTREVSADILYDIIEKGAYANLALNKSLSAFQDQRDRAFITNIVYGCLRKLGPVDYQLARFLKKPLKEKDRYLLFLLRVAVYELLFTAAKPHAVVNECVSCGKRRGNEGWAKLINGVLRSLLRNKDGLCWPDFGSETERSAFFASIPDWITALWTRERGTATALNLIEAFNVPAATVLRVNTLKTTRQELKAALAAADIDTVEGSLSGDALRLQSGVGIGNIFLFQQGHFIVQEEASQLVARVLAPRPGARVLDMCAAPGGKTTHMAQLMENQGEILALDVHAHKIKLIEENAARLGIDIIEARLEDGRNSGERYKESFDAILLDAPCSGLGVLSRRLDSRFKKEAADVEALAALQRELLASAYQALKPGGRLVYSTCTLSKAENSDNAAWFLEQYPDLRAADFSIALPGLNDAEKAGACQGSLELLPFLHHTDGFFISLFEKVKS